MWIDRHEYERLVSDLATSRASLEWMRVQLNTVQQEKATLLSAVTKQPVMTPTIRPADSSPIAPNVGDGTHRFLSELSAMFEDVGDGAAQALGIDHDPAGAVVYR